MTNAYNTPQEYLAQVSDMAHYVHSQLPRMLAEKLSVKVNSDAFHFVTTAVFIDQDGHAYQCRLELENVNNRQMACKIPEKFLAHLCAVVS